MEGKTTATATATPKEEAHLQIKQGVEQNMRDTIKAHGRVQARTIYDILLHEIKDTPEHIKGIYAAAYKEVFEVQNED